MEEGKTRLNKFLSEAGVCSRREADRQIEAGQVRIDDHVAQVGEGVAAGQKVYYQGKLVNREQQEVLLLVNKPRGIVCTAEKREKNNIVDYLHYPTRIYPVGRLDKDSRGLILMTNNGEIVNKIMRAGNHHEKEYLVKVNKPLTKEAIKGLSRGVYLPELEVTTRSCMVEQMGEDTMRIILTQGYNRQIRRMCQEFGYRVMDLQRIRIMNLQLGKIKEGSYREITKEEYQELKRLIADSKNNYNK